MHLVLVFWDDASHNSALRQRQDFEKEWVGYAAGILADIDKTHISIAQEYFPRSDEYRDVQHIPRKNVLEIRHVSMPDMGKTITYAVLVRKRSSILMKN